MQSGQAPTHTPEGVRSKLSALRKEGDTKGQTDTNQEEEYGNADQRAVFPVQPHGERPVIRVRRVVKPFQETGESHKRTTHQPNLQNHRDDDDRHVQLTRESRRSPDN